ncbi:hypothetical protein GCM10009430_20440 [Aquimarina litoralis]|uniref:Uncharacterized protein n=1 Tax=Aquimarina litoralis TaxID=584605 RepID=A0ABN1ISD4_9FLAO
MRFFIGIFLVCFSFSSFGQENPSLKISWEAIGDHISEIDAKYTLEHKEITPSLSYIRKTIATGNYQLMEINLAVDLRKQHLKNETPILLLPENKFVQSEYNVAIPTATPQSAFRVSITGNGGYNNSNTSNGGIKNNAYRDASTYTGIYCPVTGVPLTY